MAVEKASTGGQETRYSSAAAAIHWLSAALIIAQMWLGFTFHDFPKGTPERAFYFDWHKTVGVIILLLALGRLALRLMRPAPGFPEGTPGWQRMLATWGHRLLYAFMILLPLTGLMAVSRGGPMTGLKWGLSFPTIPDFMELHDLHEPLAFGMIVLLVVHVLGGLRNQFLGDGLLAGRMPPFARRS